MGRHLPLPFVQRCDQAAEAPCNLSVQYALRHLPSRVVASETPVQNIEASSIHLCIVSVSSLKSRKQVLAYRRIELEDCLAPPAWKSKSLPKM